MKSLAARFHDEVFRPYVELLKAQHRFHPRFAQAREIWEQKLCESELLNGPYLEKSVSYAAGRPLDSLPLDSRTFRTIREKLSGRRLYLHQSDAMGLILAGNNSVIASGTSSGKTLCYQIPILDDLVRNHAPGLRAIIVYPLNALVNDQLNEWQEILGKHPQITFARFTGQTPDSEEEYQKRLRAAFREQERKEHPAQTPLQQKVEERLKEELAHQPKNRLNHRDDIRALRPHILITNFSMLEYLLERPVDAPIFDGSRLRFLVLDEAHAYRGALSTEIAFLIRRLKDRLGLERLTCIATSATLGKPDDPESRSRVRRFASDLFGEPFEEPNPVYGTPARPELSEPAFYPRPGDYLRAAESLRKENHSAVRRVLAANQDAESLTAVLRHDGNLHRLREQILTQPKLLRSAAKDLWPSESLAEEGLQALMEIVAAANAEESGEDLLPTRLHYFLRAQDGLHICLHRKCPGRLAESPAFFVSRRTDPNAHDGLCPDCARAGRRAQLVEVVSCRKCGYLYGALQDLGPRRAKAPENQEQAYFDSFTTELGWAADSFWSYFAVDDELPYPRQADEDEEEDEGKDLIAKPATLEWCVACGKKSDPGRGDNCVCSEPHLRTIQVFHRQCPHFGKAGDVENLYSQQKRLLVRCPNCGARSGSGLEPVRRFQESEDETGLAIAVPLAHFRVTATDKRETPQRKLLCFTDHRQRAAAFPSLLEEETFLHDLGRKIVETLKAESEPLELQRLGERLADVADPGSPEYDPDFFLPVSRFPEGDLDTRAKGDLWVAEVFSYFGIPDSARESAEDLGLVAVKYRVDHGKEVAFQHLLNPTSLTVEDGSAALQVLLGFMRQRKAFTVPRGVAPNAPAFGRVTADIGFSLVRKRGGSPNICGWRPVQDSRENTVVSYLRRLLATSRSEATERATEVWEFLISGFLIERNGIWRLDHERLLVELPPKRYCCARCSRVTVVSARGTCPRMACEGQLKPAPFDGRKEGFVARWVAGVGEPRFSSLRSEEHTAQIAKDLAKVIEDDFQEGRVNLLSSTTTFELGIDIGDLQEVLLRNAPPSSANYIQRVGRAGRGRDKNSICVTVCRRSKYDADCWADPRRLMSGEVRTPAVFLKNPIMAQRHLNAALFAEFLRRRILLDRALGTTVKQRVRLEPFLSVEARAKIPPDWIKVEPRDLHFDFCGWLDEQEKKDIGATAAFDAIVEPLSGFHNGKEASRQRFARVMLEITEEMSALLAEREKLSARGADTEAADVGRTVKNLLGSDIIEVLARRGFLPRYAFPLDVVSLETGRTRWSSDSDVELTRERGIAIAEFAPGAQVIAHKKVFTCAGLYVVGGTDRPEARWFSECPGCGQIRTASTKDKVLGSCSVCDARVREQQIHRFVVPIAFSVRTDQGGELAARHRRGTLIRQRQTLTHFIDVLEEAHFSTAGRFSIALKQEGRLFRYNLGPKKKGFMLCPGCGFSEPFSTFKPGKTHRKLRGYGDQALCPNERLWAGMAYGHEFCSSCLVLRPLGMTGSTESMAFALQKGLCITVDVEPSAIGVSWRYLESSRGQTPGTEIILYDNTPGGAGFVEDGYRELTRVVEKAFDVCAECSCDGACYDCLKTYNNQNYHERLKRRDVVDFLEAEVQGPQTGVAFGELGR